MDTDDNSILCFSLFCVEPCLFSIRCSVAWNRNGIVVNSIPWRMEVFYKVKEVNRMDDELMQILEQIEDDLSRIAKALEKKDEKK